MTNRNVPHPRKRYFHGSSGTRRIRGAAGDGAAVRIAGKDFPDHQPGPPAIGFLYDDLAQRELRRPRKVFGQYPRTLIGNLLPWLRCDRHEILHVCSGSLPPGEGIRVDIRPDAHPDILADGRHLPLEACSVAAVMLDPPYTEHYARDLYGVDYPRPSHLLREAARVVRPGGRIAFVHYITPNPPRGCAILKVFGLSVGLGFPMRAVTIFEKRHRELALETP